MKLIKYFFYLCILVLVFDSCGKDDDVLGDGNPNPKVVDYSYFPINIGHWVVYDVDSTVYDEVANGKKNSYQFQIKEVVQSVFKDNTGKDVLRVERYRRVDSTAKWALIKVLTFALYNESAHVYEDNRRIVKLVFPMQKNKTWNGYVFTDLEEQLKFKFIGVAQSDTVNSKTLENVSTVLQQDEVNAIQYFHVEEKYAKDIGLVAKIIIRDSSNVSVIDKPFEERITGGIEYRAVLNAYGN